MERSEVVGCEQVTVVSTAGFCVLFVGFGSGCVAVTVAMLLMVELHGTVVGTVKAMSKPRLSSACVREPAVHSTFGPSWRQAGELLAGLKISPEGMGSRTRMLCAVTPET